MPPTQALHHHHLLLLLGAQQLSCGGRWCQYKSLGYLIERVQEESLLIYLLLLRKHPPNLSPQPRELLLHLLSSPSPILSSARSRRNRALLPSPLEPPPYQRYDKRKADNAAKNDPCDGSCAQGRLCAVAFCYAAITIKAASGIIASAAAAASRIATATTT